MDINELTHIFFKSPTNKYLQLIAYLEKLSSKHFKKENSISDFFKKNFVFVIQSLTEVLSMSLWLLYTKQYK